MKIKTSELSGVALNYAVAIACDYKCALETPENGPDEWIVMGREMMWLERNPDWFDVWSPSTDWSQGGPLIEKFGIRLLRSRNGYSWYAGRLLDSLGWNERYEDFDSEVDGNPTGNPLIAACRAIVAAKLGDEVDVPEGLV